MSFKLLVLAIIILNACAVAQNNSPSITPIPPSELLSLPRDGLVQCFLDPNLDQNGVTVWELPGLPSPDPDSNVGGDTGQPLGVVRNCATVRVVDYVWSETDYEFYVYIKTETITDIVNPDTNKLEGWIPMELIDLSP